MVNQILRGMARELDALYAKTGRPSIRPERLLRAEFGNMLRSANRIAC
jgi:hypothetical protein